MVAVFASLTAVTAATPDPEAELIKSNPEYLTKSPKLSITGQAQGGKSRFEPWKTDYGSYDWEDTSSYQLRCTIKTLVQTPQRVRMQAFRLSRNLDTNAFEVMKVGDFKVTHGGHIPTTVGATCKATNTDLNLVGLGIRERGGDKYVGWTWRAIDGQGKICAVVSSQSAFDHFAKEQPVEIAK